MTAADVPNLRPVPDPGPPTILLCTACGGTNTSSMPDGSGWCFDCVAPVDPDATPKTPEGDAGGSSPGTGPGDRGPENVLGPPADLVADRDAQAYLDSLIGTDVVLDGGQRAKILSFPDDDSVEVEIAFGDGTFTSQTVGFNDVIRSVETPLVVEIPDETALQLASVNATVAVLAIRAARATIIRDAHGDVVLDVPPSGWLIRDPDAWAVVEQGVAYAIALVVTLAGIDPAWLDDVANDLQTNLENGQETQP